MTLKKENFVVWNAGYSVNWASLDDGHYKIISALNRLLCLEKEGVDGAVVKSILQDLLIYTQQHCTLEESLMRQWESACYQRQKQAHEQMIVQTKVLVETSFQTEAELFEKSVALLSKWWVKHIQTMDREYIADEHVAEANREGGLDE